MSKSSVGTPEKEIQYLHRTRSFDNVLKGPDHGLEEGFAYFESEEYLTKYSTYGSVVKDKFLKLGFPRILGGLGYYAIHFHSLFGNLGKAFDDIEPYLNELESTGHIMVEKTYCDSYPNKDLWNELTQYAWTKWKVRIGYTKLPQELIFKGKTVLFPYAIVCIQEMQKDKIAKAPEIQAGGEAIRVYDSLGKAVNDIAMWLRTTYSIKCQSNHPIGGLVSTPPLAVKAGMGIKGKNGLLITPEFGQRQRIATIFTQEQLFEFTDGTTDHSWMQNICDKCKRCMKSCPVNAIREETDQDITIKNVDGIGDLKTSINRRECFSYFNGTLGCSVCVKVCPFSKSTSPC